MNIKYNYHMIYFYNLRQIGSWKYQQIVISTGECYNGSSWYCSWQNKTCTLPWFKINFHFASKFFVFYYQKCYFLFHVVTRARLIPILNQSYWIYTVYTYTFLNSFIWIFLDKTPDFSWQDSTSLTYFPNGFYNITLLFTSN